MRQLDRTLRSAPERGATLVLATAALVVLVGMAGFAVDLGWLYFKASQATKAAEAAALGGVVHMPQPGSVPFVGSEAFKVANEIASRNGYITTAGTTVTPAEVAGHPNRLEVAITTTVPTFFMKVFGIDEVSLTRDATAEHLPPLLLGSDDPFIGEDPEDPSRNVDYWLSVNGTYTGKNEGDPFSTVCYWGSGGSGGAPYPPVPGSACDETGNYQYRDPAYYFGIRVPASDAGSAMTVEVYDGAWTDPATPGNETQDYHYRYDVTPYVTEFTLYAPDQTPDNPTDNSNVVCSRSYAAEGSLGYNPAESDAWTSLCTTGAVAGTYVVTVDVSGGTYSNNKYSLRTLMNGGVSSNVEMFGFEALSLAMHEPDSAPQFKVARIDEIYAGASLIVGLWDAGDLNDPGQLRFKGSLTDIDCQVRERDAWGNITLDWHADDGETGCKLDIAVKEHNGEWLEFRFDIPDTYTCPASCWSTVEYKFGSEPHDRTTWIAYINGGPIHLLP